MAVKFLIDGQASLNIVVMNSLEGQGSDKNFFARNFSNKIDPPKSRALWLLSKIFEFARKPANDLPISHLAQQHQDGARVPRPRSPKQLVLKPSAHITTFIPSDSQEDLRDSLRSIPAGTVLYEVYGLNENGRETYIGSLQTESEFISSRYGDKKLFFQHKR